jgi:hypothetical protein
MDFDLYHKIKDWALDGDMDGFDTLAATEVGDFDYMSLLKGGAGLLSGAGGMMSGGGGTGGGGAPAAAAEAEKQRIHAAQVAAESSARTWKIVGGIALAVVGLGGIALIARPRTVP